MYHRVAGENLDPWGLCVTPQDFDAQMAVLARHRAQTDLAAFASGGGFCRQGSKLAVTFDDGYIDNITHALPVLEKHEIPATIFVIASMLGRKREFWWDALARAMFDSKQLPSILTLSLGGELREFQLDGDRPHHRAAEAAWRADHSDPSTPRQILFLELWSAIVLLTPPEQEEAVDQILAWADCSKASPPGSIPAEPEDIARLAKHPLIRIGSHTLDHVSLTDWSPADQWNQIQEGHRVVEELAGKRVDRFSYPFGRYDDNTLGFVRRLGVDIACTSRAAVATPRMDRHLLPRLQVSDMNGEAFARWLQDEHGLLAGKELH